MPGTEKQLYYIFVESLNAPATDPVVLWWDKLICTHTKPSASSLCLALLAAVLTPQPS